MQASHLLVKHRESRRPSSWKESNITRSKEEALQILKGIQTLATHVCVLCLAQVSVSRFLRERSDLLSWPQRRVIVAVLSEVEIWVHLDVVRCNVSTSTTVLIDGHVDLFFFPYKGAFEEAT